MAMESILTTVFSAISSLVVVAISWGRFSTRLDALENNLTYSVTKQDKLSDSLVSLQVEIAKLTGEIKNLRSMYEKS